MPALSQDASPFAEARDLPALVARARLLGLDMVLDDGLEVLHERITLSADAVEIVDAIDDLGREPSLGELATDAVVQRFLRTRATVAQRSALLGALRVYFESRLAATRSPPAGDGRLAALEEWAARHHVTALLALKLRAVDRLGWQLSGEDRRYIYTAPRGFDTVRGLFDPRLGALPSAARRALPGLQQAARRWLVAEAELARAAIEDENARLARPAPAHPVARALHARVLQARAEVRLTASPEHGSRLRTSAHFQPDPPLLSVEVNGRSFGQVRLPLQSPDDRLEATCTCAAGPARCAHVLAAHDVLIDLLVEPGQRGAAEIVAALALPAWERALVELDRQLASTTTPESSADASRLAWRLGHAGGDLQLTPVVQRAAKKGGFTAGSRVWPNDLARALPEGALPADGAAVDALLNGYRYGVAPRRNVRRALQALIGHPRVTTDAAPFATITVRAGKLGLAARERDGGGLVLEPLLDGAPIDPRALDGQPGEPSCVFDEERHVCTLVEPPPALAAIIGVLARRGGDFPPEAIPALAERLPALAERVGLALPASLRGAEVAADERVLLRLEARGELGVHLEARVRPLPEGAAHPPGVGPVEVVGRRGEARVHARRDLAAEAARVRTALAPLGLRADAEQEPFTWTLDRAEEALDVLAALRASPAPFVVEWSGAPRAVTRAAGAAELRVSLADHRDWFGVSGGVDVDGEVVSLAALLAAIRGGRGYVEVKDGMWARVSDELRARLAPAVDLVGTRRGGLEVATLAAPALAGLVADDGAPRRFRELLARLRSADDRTPAPPAGLDGVLRDYQVTGYQWLSRLAGWGAGACLADDMGLGKTVQALALLVERAPLGPALVVAPTSVAWNWAREAARFTPGLTPVMYGESDRADALARLGPGQVLVVSYGLLARHAEAFAAVRFATLVLDESQAIKNPNTQRARAAVALAADFRVALTGTPIENRLAELWSLFRVVAPGLLGSWDQFRDRYAAPIEKNNDGERRAALARLVRPFILRRLKGEVAGELPARTEVREEVTLSPAERARYDELRRAALAALGQAMPGVKPEQRRFQILAALTRLRQLACHPRLVDPNARGSSAKLERCLELIDELRDGGHRALVFSQFTAHLALVREALDEAGVPTLYLDGQTPAGQRRQLVDAFQGGEGDVFLISLKAGGTGLNLTGADYVIHLDPWWNPAVEDQASDRAHRIGQTRPVTIYRLVARDTIEEKILALHADKRRLVAGILEGTGTSAAVTSEELLGLLRDSR